jgi:hypothetical protein
MAHERNAVATTLLLHGTCSCMAPAAVGHRDVLDRSFTALPRTAGLPSRPVCLIAGIQPEQFMRRLDQILSCPQDRKHANPLSSHSSSGNL